MNAPRIDGWDIIQPHASVATKGAAISMSANGRHGRHRPVMTISINPQNWTGEPMPIWLAHGQKLWVMRGRGEFAGHLRLMPNGDTLLRHVPRGRGLMMRVPAIDGHPDKGATVTSVEFDWSDGWLDITLPAWMGTAAKPAPASAVPAAKPANARPSAAEPFVLGRGVASHPDWVSDKARAEHERAVGRAKGGAT